MNNEKESKPLWDIALIYRYNFYKKEYEELGYCSRDEAISFNENNSEILPRLKKYRIDLLQKVRIIDIPRSITN